MISMFYFGLPTFNFTKAIFYAKRSIFSALNHVPFPSSINKQFLFMQYNSAKVKGANALIMAGQYNQIMDGAFSKMGDFLENHQGFIKKALGNPSDLKRLFKASNHDFSAAAFHEKCDGIEDTLVAIKMENGKIFGGFTHYPWGSPDKVEVVDDPDCKAFLFSLDMVEKFVPKNGNSLIVRSKEAGPIFGSGHDIFISDRCHQNKESYSAFPSTYNSEGSDKLKSSMDVLKLFTGEEGWNFSIEDYEVYQVLYE